MWEIRSCTCKRTCSDPTIDGLSVYDCKSDEISGKKLSLRSIKNRKINHENCRLGLIDFVHDG
jgi:hypothetical protein